MKRIIFLGLFLFFSSSLVLAQGSGSGTLSAKEQISGLLTMQVILRNQIKDLQNLLTLSEEKILSLKTNLKNQESLADDLEKKLKEALTTSQALRDLIKSKENLLRQSEAQLTALQAELKNLENQWILPTIGGLLLGGFLGFFIGSR